MFCQWKRRWFYIDFIWRPFSTPSLTLVSRRNTQRSYLAFQRRHTQTQQQRPESPTVTLTWHASKYKALNSTRGTSSCLFHQLSTELCAFLMLLFVFHFDVTKMSYVMEGTPRSSPFCIQVTEEIQVNLLQSFLQSVVFTSVGLTF